MINAAGTNFYTSDITDLDMINRSLKKELERMQKEDQKMRRLGKSYRAIDKRNVARLKQIIKKYGWPSSSLAGTKGEFAAWLIAQHADFDVNFQEKCLNLLKRLPKTSNRRKIIAYLTDRTLVNRKKKQIYGTQFYHGKPRPIKDINNLNKRRKQMGLESFETYRKRMIRYAK
ncbi:MAG TPA: DUF6624 domain-containing protein [Candidatus Nanoarchaeia archaeon]|nr:DUF6624 domain-containing protein [Candidatus Nanoarchaeia archaeon]